MHHSAGMVAVKPCLVVFVIMVAVINVRKHGSCIGKLLEPAPVSSKYDVVTTCSQAAAAFRCLARTKLSSRSASWPKATSGAACSGGLGLGLHVTMREKTRVLDMVMI